MKRSRAAAWSSSIRPPIPLAAGTETTLFLVGDGTNQSPAVFTFEAGLIGGDLPTGRRLNLPVVFAN